MSAGGAVLGAGGKAAVSVGGAAASTGGIACIIILVLKFARFVYLIIKRTCVSHYSHGTMLPTNPTPSQRP